MLHIESEEVRLLLLEGNFGLEKESLRVLGDATMAHTPDPFPYDEHVTRDFCENQVEINTGVHGSASGAVAELKFHHERIVKTLRAKTPREYLWPSSNPPIIKDEDDVPVAYFTGRHESKTVYRNYLSDKYGRYKMAFSGIHVNYSFAEKLLAANWRVHSGGAALGEAYREHLSRLYLDLAQGLVTYGWLLTAVTAASPVLDNSFFEHGFFGGDTFTGMASVRSSELGYWNAFAPIFDYSNERSYAESIRSYVQRGFIRSPSELYYPIRLKPHGENTLENLGKGIGHIELRMFDLNPLSEIGLDERDVQFAQLLIIWLASTPQRQLSERDQVQAVQNFKNAARYDLKTVKILTPSGESATVADEGARIIKMIWDFFRNLPESKDPNGKEAPPFPEVSGEAQGGEATIKKIERLLAFEFRKMVEPEARYARQVRKAWSEGFLKGALEQAKKFQGGA